MTNTIVLGVKGDSALYMIDLDAKTVEPIDAAMHAGVLQAAHDRAAGAPIVNGINIAVKIDPAPLASAGHFDGH